MAEREWIQGHICFLERHEITSTLIAGLERHWDGVRGTRAMPRRDEIDPIDLVPWLPYVSMMELHYDPFRVRYRVVGTEVARIIGEDFSNRWLDETGWGERIFAPAGFIEPAVGEDFSNRWLDETGWGEDAIALNRLLYERVAESRAPSFGLSTVTWQGKPDHVFQWVLFPLGDGDVVTHCLSLDDLSVIAPRSRLLP